MDQGAAAIAYYRVSTAKQGASGLGLEAQRRAVADLIARKEAKLIASFEEVESGKSNDRPELQKAMRQCKLTGATLVISKLDRLSRNAAFLLALRDSGIRFIAADMPDANELTVGIMAVLAEDERKRISTRTKEALAAAKARGQKLGNPRGAAALRRAGKGNADSLAAIQSNADAHAEALRPIIADLKAQGVTSLNGIAKALTEAHIKTARGGSWFPSTVRNLLDRLEAATEQPR